MRTLLTGAVVLAIAFGWIWIVILFSAYVAPVLFLTLMVSIIGAASFDSFKEWRRKRSGSP
jgi:hypothetical protein